MQIYLPIAEVSVNIFILLGLGGIVGFLSGMFGVGGGFLITPLLFFIGIPPAIAVATGANQVVASHAVSRRTRLWPPPAANGLDPRPSHMHVHNNPTLPLVKSRLH